MTDKILYFLRHGQAESNANHFFAGQGDAALTALGIEQAKATAPMLAHIKFDKVFCSDLQRARNTAALALPNVTCEYLPLIREISVGKLTFRKVDECREEYGALFTEYHARTDFSPFGGESREQLDARACEFLNMVADLEDTPVVGAVCHGGFMRAAARVVLGDPLPLAMPDNCAVCVFEYKNGYWSLRRWNAVLAV